MHILVIDDDKALCRSLQILLEAEGHSVDCAHLGREGIKAIYRVRPELTLVDLQLPDISGLEVLRQISESNVATHAVVISGVQDVGATVHTGEFDFMRKPLSIDSILLTIRKVAQIQSESGPVYRQFVAASPDDIGS